MNFRQRVSIASFSTVICGLFLISPSGASPALIDSPSPETGNIQIIDQGETPTGGWVEYTGTGAVTLGGAPTSGAITPQAVQNVGGGTWAFGSGVNSAGQKSCYSQYYHASVKHGSSVSMDGYYHADHNVAKGKTSYARITRHTTATCKAFYTKN